MRSHYRGVFLRRVAKKDGVCARVLFQKYCKMREVIVGVTSGGSKSRTELNVWGMQVRAEYLAWPLAKGVSFSELTYF